jgi:glycosyltransferase involved in cell wall biosynthesis
LVGAGEVAIAVPVRNEAERLPRLLDALARQTRAPRFSLCLFFDNCTDGSRAIVEAHRARLAYRILSAGCDAGGPPNAGVARRRATDLAAHAAPGGTILTTDADSEPAVDWIAANLAALDHADVVAGRIVRNGTDAPKQDRLERYLDGLHALRRALDPVPWEGADTHHWVSAASLAMRTTTYARLGGFPALASGEDAALGDAAARAGLRLRRDAGVTVRTSARRHGRATAGLAAALAAMDRDDADPVVTHPEDEAWRFAAQAAARVRHDAGPFDDLAKRLHLPLAEVTQVASECANGEAFAARIVGAPQGGLRQVPLAHAEAILANLGALLEGAA